MTDDCLFCKIAAKKIPSKIVYEDRRGLRLRGYRAAGADAHTHLSAQTFFIAERGFRGRSSGTRQAAIGGGRTGAEG